MKTYSDYLTEQEIIFVTSNIGDFTFGPLLPHIKQEYNRIFNNYPPEVLQSLKELSAIIKNCYLNKDAFMKCKSESYSAYKAMVTKLKNGIPVKPKYRPRNWFMELTTNEEDFIYNNLADLVYGPIKEKTKNKIDEIILSKSENFKIGLDNYIEEIKKRYKTKFMFKMKIINPNKAPTQEVEPNKNKL